MGWEVMGMARTSDEKLALMHKEYGELPGVSCKTCPHLDAYCNAEELMIVANKRLCGKASAQTQQAVKLMRACVIDKYPEFEDLLVPMCLYQGDVCHEIELCGRYKR